jgi:uncharacterized protein (TIGR03083 family)
MNGSLSTEEYRSSFHQEWEALVAAAPPDQRARVPACPEWTVAVLAAHVGEAYAFVEAQVRGGGEDSVNELEDLGLPSDIEEWFRRDLPLDSIPRTLVDWLRNQAESLEALFSATDPSAPAWTWWDPDRTAGFWLRRMAQETSIHRWDMENVAGAPAAIPAALAADGVDEMLDIYVPRWCRPKSEISGSGETYCLRRSDGPGAWTVRYLGYGMEVAKDEGAAGVTLTGSASDLILALWQRIPLQRLRISGDLSLLERWFQLAPPD